MGRPINDDPGRNSPCRCGSGRKYKKCCLRRDADASAGGGVRAKLALFALERPSRAALEDAWRQYRDTDEPLESFLAKQDERMGPFLDWLTKGRRLEGRTARERFAEEIGPDLDDGERRELEEIMATRFGVFEVVAVRPGVGASFVDISAGKRIEVCDVSASRGMALWDIATAWVGPGPRGDELWGQALLFRPGDKAGIRKELADAYERAKTAEPRLDWQAFLDSAAPTLSRLQTRLRAAERRLFTSERDPLCLSRATYSVDDFAAALKALRSCAALDEASNRLGEGGRLVEAAFDWIGALPRASATDGESGMTLSTQTLRPDGGEAGYELARVVLTRAELRVECASRPRLERARALVEKAARKSLRFKSEDFQPLTTLDMLPERKRRAPKPSPAAAASLAASLLDYAERWIQEPIPALNGRSPADAVRDAQGRELLLDLLKSFEHRDADSRGDDAGNPAAPCQAAMRRLLGLPVPGELEARVERLKKLASEASAPPEDPLLPEFERALNLHRKSRAEDALRAYERLEPRMRAHQAKHQLWANMATCHLQAGRFEEGIRCLETALEVRPDYEFAAMNLVRARRLRSRRKVSRRSSNRRGA